MKKSLFLNTVIAISFWWMLYLLFLIFGFGIQLFDIIHNIFSYNIHFSIVSILLLSSPILYGVFLVIRIVKGLDNDLGIFETIGIGFVTYFWPIYKQLDFRHFEFSTWLYHLFRSVIWWGSLSYALWTIFFTNRNNYIISQILSFSKEEIFFRIGIFSVICLGLFGIAEIISHSLFKHYRNELS